jgi:hypothetical protein
MTPAWIAKKSPSMVHWMAAVYAARTGGVKPARRNA